MNNGHNPADPRMNYAKPAVYIDVVLNGQKTVYDVPTARALISELTKALSQIDDDGNLKDPSQHQAADETQKPS